jgi:hypothetical protein
VADAKAYAAMVRQFSRRPGRHGRDSVALPDYSGNILTDAMLRKNAA